MVTIPQPLITFQLSQLIADFLIVKIFQGVIHHLPQHPLQNDFPSHLHLDQHVPVHKFAGLQVFQNVHKYLFVKATIVKVFALSLFFIIFQCFYKPLFLVETHFRRALGEETFQKLRNAQAAAAAAANNRG